MPWDGEHIYMQINFKYNTVAKVKSSEYLDNRVSLQIWTLMPK